jgi:uncharacterized protein (DUF302 family)/uncharacterized membrane protein YidH (DUF202 family)
MELNQKYQANPSDFLAVERTFLAWIRTGLALMALGFVLARFGLFLQEFNVIRPGLPTASFGYSLWFGTILILLGVLVSILSLVRYLRLIAQLKSGGRSFDNASTLAVAVAILLGVLGLAMSYYLLATRHVSTLNSSALKEASMSATPEKSAIPDNGIVRIASEHPVTDTVAKLKTILQLKNVKLFAIVDHSDEAEKAGLKMPNTKLLIFGNPKGGTPLMLASPSVAIDLPLKILVAEDAAGKVWVSYNAPAYLQRRHNLPTDLLPNFAVIEAIATNGAQ